MIDPAEKRGDIMQHLEDARAKDPTIREFFLVVWRHWGPLMSGVFSVPFASLSVFAESTYGKIIWGAMAVLAFLVAAYLIWANERKTVVAFQDRLAPKIMLFLNPDPFGQTTGIEIAKGTGGDDVPYIQVCAEPITDITIYDPVPHITKIEHRANETSVFYEVLGESRPIDWSWQQAGATLSKGKPLRFNIVSYNENTKTPYDIVNEKSSPNKLLIFYSETGKSGEYRYTVHVEGRGVVPARAQVYVKWRPRGHPKVTLASIAERKTT
jgi:hypothetical protein